MKFKLMLFALLFSSVLFAQDEMKNEHKRGEHRGDRMERMEAIKIAYITKELELTPEESQVFWPVYNKHHAKLKELRKNSKPRKKYEELTEAEAEEFVNRFIENEYAKAKIHEEMINELKLIIGSKRLLHLFKVEQKFKKEILKRGKKRKGKSSRKRK